MSEFEPGSPLPSSLPSSPGAFWFKPEVLVASICAYCFYRGIFRADICLSILSCINGFSRETKDIKEGLEQLLNIEPNLANYETLYQNSLNVVTKIITRYA